MIRKIIFIAIIVLTTPGVYAQNIGIGTTTPAARLHIKGSANISQLTIDANSTQSNTNPLIRLRNSAGTDILHIHSDNANNVFLGVDAGKVNNAAGNATYNTFLGSAAGNANSTGQYNTACGGVSLFSNTTGFDNTVCGGATLYSNTTGFDNTAIGFIALYYNTTGVLNTAVGSEALYSNTAGNYNTTVGANSLYGTTASYYNTAIGYHAGSSYDNGYNNVFIGANTDVNGTGFYNVIAIGQNTICTSPSQVTMGNTSTIAYRTYTNWTNISDGRFKKNVIENVPGLDFIKQLRPVTYNLDATGLDIFLHKNENSTERTSNKKIKGVDDASKNIYNKALQEKEKVTYTGFVAQEVETAAHKLGFNFSGVDAPKNENDVYGLRYAEFVVPLVKAVQEQQQQIEELKKENKDQKDINTLLQKQIDELKMLIKNNQR